ncbi:hypothetical protein [Maridesulfovibrio sp.]|uniref:hypothetical protein n=1 Tax=Maridesulfovibrio sp. TaxID=2795000 RepID=UPI003BACD941
MATMFVMLFLVAMAEASSAGMLVAEGKRSHYIANQEEGIVYVVYGDGEWVRFADGFGRISGLCAAPDSSVYVLSESQSRLYRVTVDGKVQMVRKLGSCPQAIFVDRDGEVKFVQRNGVVTGVN